MTNIAKDIIEGAPVDDNEEEEEAGDQSSFEEEYGKLYEEVEKLQSRYTRLAAAQATDSKPLTRKDLSLLYSQLSDDLLSIVKDAVSLTGAAVAEIIDTQDPDSVDEELFDEQIQVYTTLATNCKALETLATQSTDPDAQRTINQLLDMNRASMKLIEERYGDENVKGASAELIQNSMGTSGAEAEQV